MKAWFSLLAMDALSHPLGNTFATSSALGKQTWSNRYINSLSSMNPGPVKPVWLLQPWLDQSCSCSNF